MSNIPKVVFRVGKLKDAGKINAALAHNSRRRVTLNANLDTENIVIKSCTDAYSAVLSTIGNQTIRKNAVMAVEVIISASPQYFRPTEPGRFGYWENDKLQAWRKAVEPWILEKFPHAVSVVLHLDEATPHFHVIDVPLDERGKLSARTKFGGDKKSDIKKWQDWSALPVKHLGITRGIEGSVAMHEDIKNFYSRIGTDTPKPKKLPYPEPLPFMQRTDDGLIKFAQKERNSVYQSLRPTYLSLESKAKSVELFKAERDSAIETATKLSRDKIALKKTADLLREIPIDQVLRLIYGAELKKDCKINDNSRKWLTNDAREIAVSKGDFGLDVWIDQGGKGRRGAINLVMYLDNLDYKSAVKLLTEYFDQSTVSAERMAQLSTQVLREIKEISQEPLKPPAPVVENWHIVREYLINVRSLPHKLVDWMHQHRKVYADRFNNAVFVREKGGAFLRGTKDKSFFRTIGNKAQGSFILQGDGDVWICESPIDAASIKSYAPQAHVISIGGNIIKLSEVDIPVGRKVFAAFDNDAQGQKFTDELVKIHPATKSFRPPAGKDWNVSIQNNNRLIDSDWLDISILQETKTGKFRLKI